VGIPAEKRKRGENDWRKKEESRSQQHFFPPEGLRDLKRSKRIWGEKRRGSRKKLYREGGRSTNAGQCQQKGARSSSFGGGDAPVGTRGVVVGKGGSNSSLSEKGGKKRTGLGFDRELAQKKVRKTLEVPHGEGTVHGE